MALSLENRLKLKKRLPAGASSKVARDLGITRQAISNYIRGWRNNEKIENALIEEIKAHIPQYIIEKAINEFLEDNR